MSETIFDKILAKQIPAKVAYEDDDVFAFYDIAPQAPLHVLVIPKKKARGFEELRHRSSSEVGAFFCGVSRVAHHLGLEKDGYRVVVNHGTHGQQSVDYIHAHILGGRPLNWPPG